MRCDATRDRHPVHVNVERRQEDADLPPVAGRRNARHGLAGDEHPAVRRRQHRARPPGDLPVRIAEEEGKQPAQHDERESQAGPPEHSEERGWKGRGDDERQPGTVDSHRGPAVATRDSQRALQPGLPPLQPRAASDAGIGTPDVVGLFR
jgi:hypothetical protein